MGDDRAYLEGWQNAADYIGLNIHKLLEYRAELKQRRVAWRHIKGTPPNRRVVIRVWKNLLQAWFIEKFL